MGHQEQIDDLLRRREHALGMGGAERLARRRASGILNARERLDVLCDPGSFRELGQLSASARAEDRHNTPADGKISGFALLDGRRVAIVSNDFTVRGASSATTNNRKLSYMRRTATKAGAPMVFLGESSGARIPDTMGAEGMTVGGQDPQQYCRRRETPWVTAVLGQSFGSATWYACISDFTVMRKGAVLAVSSARVTSVAIGEDVDPEELGGWRLHGETTGLADMVVETDEEALQAIRRFLSYLPSHHNERPPAAPVPAGSDEGSQRILDIVPAERQRVYDMRKVVQAIADKDSYFPIKDRFGRAALTALARLNGQTVGFLCANPMMKGGAMDPAACDKCTDFLVLCDSFNIPLVMLVDTPGFLVGIEGERLGAPGRIMRFMHALQLFSMPKISVIMRKSYGQAFLNMGGGANSDEIACWTSADIGFMDPAVGVKVVYGIDREKEPERARQLMAEMTRDTSPYDFAATWGAHEVLDPRETRQYLIDALDRHARDIDGRIGKHDMAAWPTFY